MLLQTNSYIVPREKRVEHTRLIRRFRQTLLRLGCDQFEVYEQVGANWSPGESQGRFVQIMRFRDRRQQQAVQAAERDDAAAQQLISEFCELINFPYQQENGFFAVGYYTGALSVSHSRAIEDPEPYEPLPPEEETATVSPGDDVTEATANAPMRLTPLDTEEPAEASMPEATFATEADEPAVASAEPLTESEAAESIELSVPLPVEELEEELPSAALPEPQSEAIALPEFLEDEATTDTAAGEPLAAAMPVEEDAELLAGFDDLLKHGRDSLTPSNEVEMRSASPELEASDSSAAAGIPIGVDAFDQVLGEIAAADGADAEFPHERMASDASGTVESEFENPDLAPVELDENADPAEPLQAADPSEEILAEAHHADPQTAGAFAQVEIPETVGAETQEDVVTAEIWAPTDENSQGEALELPPLTSNGQPHPALSDEGASQVPPLPKPDVSYDAMEIGDLMDAALTDEAAFEALIRAEEEAGSAHQTSPSNAESRASRGQHSI